MKIFAGIAAMVAGMASMVAADEQAAVAQGRQIVSKYGDAVVWINAVTKVDLGERGVREEKVECLGVVIDPCGLTVLPLNVLDQSVLIAAAMRSKGMEGKPTVTLSDVRMILADGAEVPAQIVLKDPDLDLAFVTPDPNRTQDRRAYRFVTMAGTATVDVLDWLIILGRSDPQFTREPMISLDRVACVLRKPRTLYYARSAVPGSVVFAEDGAPVGLCVTRVAGPEAVKIVVLPVEAIAKVAAQVPPGKTRPAPSPRP